MAKKLSLLLTGIIVVVIICFLKKKKKKIIITNCGNVYNFKIDEKYIYLNTNIPLLLLWLWKFEALANISRNGLNKFGFGDA